VQAYSPGSNEGDLGDEECEPGSADEAVDDEKNSGAACKAAQLGNQRRRKKVRAKPRKTAAAMNVAKLK
jgi:hypothetical protein